ncbi:protein MKS1-like [Impatiens glandulifera]|uniref:protein MKS1-like n=1 Tax=Impatiens glandulifera TaxID=253017 RepID=UPI001FB0DF38|nr:protein MKS1-like [Impatiens glandulifera]
MDPPYYTAGGNSSTSRKELQVGHHPRHPPVPPPRQPQYPPPKPIIIFSISPKPIHTTVGDFPALVQRLTGHYSGDYSADDGGGNVSPAARLASIEGASPRERDRDRGNEIREEEMYEDLRSLIEGFDRDQIRGILSPVPMSLPPIPDGFFSPVSEMQDFSVFNDLSPFYYGNMLITSPSTLYSPPFDVSRLFD